MDELDFGQEPVNNKKKKIVLIAVIVVVALITEYIAVMIVL